jgi:hypothetical protein
MGPQDWRKWDHRENIRAAAVGILFFLAAEGVIAYSKDAYHTLQAHHARQKAEQLQPKPIIRGLQSVFTGEGELIGYDYYEGPCIAYRKNDDIVVDMHMGNAGSRLPNVRALFERIIITEDVPRDSVFKVDRTELPDGFPKDVNAYRIGHPSDWKEFAGLSARAITYHTTDGGIAEIVHEYGANWTKQEIRPDTTLFGNK